MKIYTFDLIIDKEGNKPIVHEGISRVAVDSYIAWYSESPEFMGYTLADNYTADEKAKWSLPWQ